MKIIYMHHAERNIGSGHNDKNLRQLEDITERGIKETEIVAERLKDEKITAIVSSPYLRCMHTGNIINKYHNLDIVEDPRFNEKRLEENWVDFLNRNMEAIDDIYNKYDDDSIIICITSGVNLSAFVCYFYNIKPTNYIPWCQANGISPVNFTKGKKMLD